MQATLADSPTRATRGKLIDRVIHEQFNSDQLYRVINEQRGQPPTGGAMRVRDAAHAFDLYRRQLEACRDRAGLIDKGLGLLNASPEPDGAGAAALKRLRAEARQMMKVLAGSRLLRSGGPARGN